MTRLLTIAAVACLLILVNSGRYWTGVMSATVMSPDLIEEVRLIVIPPDAETEQDSGRCRCPCVLLRINSAAACFG